MKNITVFSLTLFSLLLLPTNAFSNGETISPNMSLIEPAVGITTGPQWGADLVMSLGLIDLHDHSPGKGVLITPQGLNINSDLTCNQHNVTNPRSIRFYANPAVLSGSADLGAIYESGVDLYYRDGNGNNVRLTQSGSIVGTAGSITGLTSPASASYVSANSTFVWQSAANTAANIDAGSLLLRNLTASSNAITMNPPNALAANYSLTWMGALPASQKFATVDASGNIASDWAVDNSTIEVNSNSVRIKDSGVVTAKIADSNVTTVKIADGNVTLPKLVARPVASSVSAGGLAMSSGSGNYSTTSTSFVDVTNLSVTITTTGRPVAVFMIPDPAAVGGGNYTYVLGAVNGPGRLKLLQGSTGIAELLTSTTGSTYLPGPPLYTVDTPAAGTYTYKVQAICPAGHTLAVFNWKLVAYEL